MVLIGFLGFLDPPKESAKDAITALQEHGVRTVVLTGDSEGVALKVCGKVGVNTSQLITVLFSKLFALNFIIISQNKRRYRIKYSAA